MSVVIQPRILLAGGGSGGSATPIIAVAEELRRLSPGVAMLLIGTRNGPERALAAAAGLPFQTVPSGKLRRYATWRNLVDPFLVLAGVFASFRTVERFRPDVALGAGGFASVPPLVAAALLRRPVHIHQQDAEPGLANRLLTPFARSCSVSLPVSFDRFPLDRTVLLGNPVRPSILSGDPSRAQLQFGLEPGRQVVLVTGGGTGALRLNRIVAEASPLLTEHAQVIHLTGRGRSVPAPVKLPGYRQVEFVTAEMADLLAAADLVIARAGMGTLSELSALGKPAIVIPMPGSHQRANAQAFAARGAAIVLEESDLSAASLATAARSLLDSPERLSELAENVRALMPADASLRLASRVLELSRS